MSLEGKTVDEIQSLAELANMLATDPKTRKSFLSLTKAVNPGANIPEIDIPASLQAQFAEPLKRLDALAKRQEEIDLERRIEASRRDVMVKKGVTADELTQVEKLMVEKGIANHETAIDHFRMSQRSAEPSSASTANGLRRFDKPNLDLKAFNGDQKAWSYSNAYAVIDELRGRKAAA